MTTIYIFIITFILILLLFVRYIPIQIIKIRAKKYGVKLNNNDAKELISMGCVNSLFFKQVSCFVQQKLNFDIIQLGKHCISGGSLENILSGILYAQNNGIAIELAEICVIDLASQDVLLTLKKGRPYFT